MSFSGQSQPEDYCNLSSLKIRNANRIRRQYRSEQFKSNRLAKHYQASNMHSYEYDNQNGEGQNPPTRKLTILDQSFQPLIRELVEKDITIADLPIINEHLQSQSFSKQLSGIIYLRNLLSTSESPYQKVVEEGIHILVINLMEHQNTQMRYEACWCLVNITYGDDQQCQNLVEKGALPILFHLLLDHLEIVKNAIWALSNMSCDSISLKMKIIEQSGIQRMIAAAQKHDNEDLILLVCEAFSNICRGQRKNSTKPPPFNLVKEAVLFICCMLACGHLDRDEQILKGCVYTIADYFEGNQLKDDDIQLLLSTNLLAKLVPSLVSQNNFIRQASLRCFGNLISGSFKVTQRLLKLGICDSMLDCLKFGKECIRREACWFLSNFAIDGIYSTSLILQNIPLLGKLFELFVEDTEDIRKQVLYVLANLSQNCADYNIQEIYIEAGIFQQIVQLLKSDNSYVVETVLQNLYNLMVRAEPRNKQIEIVEELYKYQGLTLINHLRFTENDRVNYQAQKIALRFFYEVDYE